MAQVSKLTKEILSISALIALVTFIGAPFLHEIVPHTHGPNNIIWDQIHSAIGFGKSGLDFFPEYTDVSVTFFFLLLTLFVYDQTIQVAEHNKLRYALTRGTLPYRKFR